LKAEKNINLADFDNGSVTAFISRSSEAICSAPAMLILEAAEDRARSMLAVSQGEPPEKRARKELTGSFPSDIGAILMIVQRLLETINYVSFLGDSAWPPASLPEGLEDALWRWSVTADILAPKGELPTWKEDAWCWLSRMLRQMIKTERPVYESLSLVQKLMKNVDDEEPEDEHIKEVLIGVFAHMQYTPQLKAVLDDMKVKSPSDSTEVADNEESTKWNCHPRVANVIEAVLPTFRGLSPDASKSDANRASLTPGKNQDGIEKPEQSTTTAVTSDKTPTTRKSCGPLGDKTNVVQEDDEMLGHSTEPVKTPLVGKSFRVVSDSLEGEDDQEDAEMALASVGLTMNSTPQSGSGKRLRRKTQVYVEADFD
jgi:hypothetical protein